MPAAVKAFVFICGPDDFIVNRLGKERFEALAAAAGADEFTREIVSGFAINVDEVETAVNRFRDAVQTVPMFGGQRVVWFKDVNFLGLAEGVMLRKLMFVSLCAKYQFPQHDPFSASNGVWQIETDPRYAGTYNYVDMREAPDNWYDLPGWAEWGVHALGHVLADYLPAKVLGVPGT